MTIDVIDTGIGIPEGELECVFDEFRQLSAGFSRKFEGTGLGLTICKKYTEILGGSIHVSSKLNMGSEFTLQLPMHTQDPNI
jgi:signal transduction histidine kinase